MRVGVDRRWIGQIHDEGDVLGVRQRLRVRHGLLEEIAALHRLKVERKALRPEPLELEEIVNQGLHPGGRSPNELHGLTQRAGALVSGLRQVGQRCAASSRMTATGVPRSWDTTASSSSRARTARCSLNRRHSMSTSVARRCNSSAVSRSLGVHGRVNRGFDSTNHRILWHSGPMSVAPEDSRPTNPFQEFFRTEAAGGALLVACASAALVVANSSWADAYHRLLSVTITIGASDHALALSVHQWINDALMSVFFLLVGLEIKREALAGELASPRHAALPIAGAIGGIVVPAFIYVLTNGGGMASRGWAIPMATDIAFALGVLALVAPRAPSGLKTFLASAIVDDMGAVLIIALFYTRTIASGALAMAGLMLLLLIALNLLRVRRLAPFLVLGVGLWFFVHESGVHATIAGVLLALTIPTRTRIDAAQFSAKARGLLDYFDRTGPAPALVSAGHRQQEAIIGLERAAERLVAPLVRLEHAIHGFSAFVVMPLFAFSNAGVGLHEALGGRVPLAVILALAIGKPLGITGAAPAAVRLRLTTLPDGVNWTALHGCAWLAGIGFTMSLFIAALAFDDTTLVDAAKVGILTGSLLAGIVGAVVVRLGTSMRPFVEK